MQHRWRGPAVVLAVAALIATACGGDESARPTTQATVHGEPRPVLASAGVERNAPNPDAPVDELVAGLNEAGFDLLADEAGAGNFVFSPMSIGHAVLMAREAAAAATSQAIDDEFGFPGGVAAHEAWNAVDQSMRDSAAASDDVTVEIADRIWPRVDTAPDQEWIDLLTAEHGVTVETLDYSGDAEGSRDVINAWVGEQTDGLIPELIPAGMLRPATVLVLTDAVFFDARWAQPFGKYPEEQGTFTRLDASEVELAYMTELENPGGYFELDDVIGAEIPYHGDEFSMLVIVPDQGAFERIRDHLDQGLVDEIGAALQEDPFELWLPKWSTSTDLDLIERLTAAGIAPGSFPGIAPDAFLDGAVHAADISVDEHGTVAAAATGFSFAESGPPRPETVIKADRPFVYLIRHNPTGLVLFAGQVTDPTE